MTNTPNYVWEQYLSGKQYLSSRGLYSQADENYRFYTGEQWYGKEIAGENMPVYNVIRNIVDYKVSSIAQKGFSIVYQPNVLSGNYERKARICELLTDNASRVWERLKMDRNMWDIILDGAVFGTSFVYFYHEDGTVKMDMVDTANILFGDEQQKDIQKQPYIIIIQRDSVSNLKNMARSFGASEEETGKIVPDDETYTFIGKNASKELNHSEENEKCISLLKLYKKGGIVHAVRVTKNAVIMPEVKIPGMKRYPVCRFAWKEDKGFSRGLSEVKPLIENQTEINKALFRLLAGIKQYAFPHIVYDSAVLNQEGVKRLSSVGSNIAVNNLKMQKIEDVIGYMQPAQIHPIANNIITQMISLTTDLAGTGEAALGTVNPENASGAAIIAVRDAAEIPLNRHVSSVKQFVEDMALVWLELIRVYGGEEISVIVTSPDGTPAVENIPKEELEKYSFDIRIDVSSKSPYSKYAREDALSRLLMNGAITFEEYVDSLDDDSASPKGKLRDILNRRTLAVKEDE